MSQVFAVAPWSAADGAGTDAFPAASPARLASGFTSDAFRPACYSAADPLAAFGSTLPGGTPNPASAGGMMSVIAHMLAQVQQQIGMLGNALMGRTAPSSGTASFSNVSLASTGDPHLSVSGNERNADGSASDVNSHFDSMVSHDDLFSTRDFGDGFRVSTTVTQPGANGITQNASATASMEGGRESVTMSNDGSLSIVDRGQSVALTPGNSVTLSGGQRVSEAANGSVSISESAFGSNLTTTFTANGGGGVDVTAQGQNVSLAGDLLTGGAAPIAAIRRPSGI